MEGVSLAIGLISLFSTCVECFDYFEAARDFPVHYEQLLTLLELEKIRLLAWGDAVGILETDNEEQISQLRQIPIIKQILAQIKALLVDASKLQQDYGVILQPTGGTLVDLPSAQSRTTARIQPLESVRRSNVLSLHSRFWAKYSRKSRPGPVSRAIWAVRDKSKFEILLNKLRGFIDGLNDLKDVIRPEVVQKQNIVIGRDIASIPSSSLPDLEYLKIVEASCSGIYPDWEEAARSSIIASEIATRDGLNIQEWNLQVESDRDVARDENTSTPNNEPKIRVGGYWKDYKQLYFMLTDSCLRSFQSESCEGYNYRRSPSNLPTYSWEVEPNKWTVARRISKVVEPYMTKYRSDAELYLSEDGVPVALRKLATVYVYCGPCPCLIKTACDICSSNLKSGHLNFIVRIDPRLGVSCCPSLMAGVDRLKSLQAASHHSVRELGYSYWPHLDHGWMDEIVFSAESEEQRVLSMADTVKRQRCLVNEYSLDHIQDVTLVLGTASYLTSIMNSLDCRSTAKVPAVGEIWQVYDAHNEWYRKPWQQYTLSKAAYKQRRELSRVPPTQVYPSAISTSSVQGSSVAASRLVSPPSSISSKRQRSPEDTDHQERRNTPAAVDSHDPSSTSYSLHNHYLRTSPLHQNIEISMPAAINFSADISADPSALAS